MEKVEYGGWPNCIRLSNGEIELIATTDVGPRVMRFGFVGGQNLLKEIEGDMGKTGGEKWVPYGGHRLWHAPEVTSRTYAPDNAPVKHRYTSREVLKLSQPTEPTTGIAKGIDISLDAESNHVTVVHRLINRNLWKVELAPWALTIMAPGGRAILPQEEYRSHSDYLLPARPMVLWHYTDMTDPRWTWGKKYIQLRQDPQAKTDQKVGIMNKQGWAAYTLGKEVFVKRFKYQAHSDYADYGCNTELFTNAGMLEVESLGPLQTIYPEGHAISHVEHWFLFKADIGTSESSIDENLLPLIRKTDAVIR